MQCVDSMWRVEWELSLIRNDQKLRVSAARMHTVATVRSYSDDVCLSICVYH